MSENRIQCAKKDRKFIWLAVGVAVGLGLLIWGSIGGGEEDKTAQQTWAQTVPDPEAYATSIEEQVVEICSRVKGAGRVEAVVTLSGGYRAVYATDSQTSSSGHKSSTVLTGSGSAEEAILIGYENPQIAGIGIVCEGGDNAAVRQQILSLVSAAFDVSTNKIYIASGQMS